MNGDDTDPHSEQIAQTWAAAGAYRQAAQENNNVDEYSSSRSIMETTIPGGLGTETTVPRPQRPPLFEPAIPQRRRLPSYVSEPPSTLLALSMMAEEEAAAQIAELGPSPFSTTTAAIGTAAQNEPRELKADVSLREKAWMHTAPQQATTAATNTANKNTVFGRSHLRTDAGDLAGAELYRRRRPPPIRLNSANALRSLSPSRTGKGGSIRSAGGVGGNPKTRVSNIQGLVRRRDADVLFADTQSDSDDNDDEKDIDKVTKGAAGSPRSDTLQRGKLGSEFDIDMPVVKPNRPFYRRRQFWVFFVLLTWTLSFVTAGVCLLVFRSVDDTTRLQAWRICFFAAGLPIIWYIGDFVTQMIVWAVERSMFTVKNALYFAYAVRKPLRNVIRALLCLGWWPLIMTVEYTGNQSDGALKAYNIILRCWGCITLFMVANLLKVLLGKVLALKFNKESHLNKMYTTLKKEQWLHCLLVPRQSYAEAGLLEGGGDGDGRGRLTHAGGSGGLSAFPTTRTRKSRKMFSKFKLSRSASAGDALDGLVGANTMNGGAGLAEKEMGDDNQMLQSRSSNVFSEKFKFWRKSSARLEIIAEESTSHMGTVSTGGGPTGGNTSDIKDFSITIDNDLPSTPTISPAAVAHTAQSPPLQPVRVDGGGIGSNKKSTGAAAIPKLQRTSSGPTSPLPPRAAIDAAYAAQKIKKSQNIDTTGTSAAGGTASMTSPLKHQYRRHPSLRSNSTAESLTSAHRTNTTLQQHNKDVAVGSMPDFGTGPLRRDEVMTRLARLERYIRKTNLEVTYRDALNNMEKSEVTNEDEAKRIGLFLFWNVKSNFEKSAISKEDLEEFIPTDDVDDAYDMLDDDGDGKVTVEDCVSAVQTIYQERSNLAASLKDTRSIASSLEVIIGVIIHLIGAMAYFYILFGVTFNQIWAFVSTTILGLSFIFGQYIRMIFENTMFLFNSHPFDVGDMLFMDNDYLTVDEIQINFTIFMTATKQRLWVPNQRMVTNPFVNLTTSGNRTESISILVDMDTPPNILDNVIAAMEALKQELPQEFSDVSGSFRDAAVPMKMTLKLFYEFTHNGTNLGRSARARSRIYVCVAQELQKSGVAYTWPAMRTLNLPAGGNGGGSAASAQAAAVGAAAADPNTASVVGVL